MSFQIVGIIRTQVQAAQIQAQGLEIRAQAEQIRVIQIAKPGCPPADFALYSGTLKREYTECAEYRSWALEQIERIQPDVIIISGAFKDVRAWVNGEPNEAETERLWQEGLARTLNRLTPMAGEVIVPLPKRR